MIDPRAPEPLLEVRNLRVEFPTRRAVLTAIDDVSMSIAPGEVLGVVGESGASSRRGASPAARSCCRAGGSTTFPQASCGESAARRSARSSRIL
jgi:ABC-type glutathione transport system ATPase component